METPQECFECDVKNQTVETRQYHWSRGGQEGFEVKLCQTCYRKTDPSAHICGRDWWDAYDNLYFSYLMPKDEKAHWDAKTAQMLGFSSPDELNQARQITRKVDLPDTSPEEKEQGQKIINQVLPKAREAYLSIREKAIQESK